MSSTSSTVSRRPAPLAPMRAGNVPRIDLRYWVAISAASVFGCNLGDFVSLYLRLGHWTGLLPLAAMFLALVIGERRSRRNSQAWYWIAVIILRTAATNVADLATHTFNIPYPWAIAVLELLQVLVILPALQPLGDNNPGAVRRPAADGWYWASLLTAGVLGTAIGDGVAEDLHLGTGIGTLALSAVMLALIGSGARSRWATKPGYWLAIIAVRVAGTTAGDWLAFGEDHTLWDGLHLGLPLATMASGAIFVLILCLWRPAEP